jgi:hypothetical protein
MFRLLLIVLALVIAYFVIQSLPDIQRYLKMRAM